jgi:hypothetical protein
MRAFTGDNAVSTLSAILRDEAKPINEVAPDVPPQIEQVVKRCLRKNPDDRWQTMQDVRGALSALKHESDSGQLYKSRVAAAKKGASPKALIATAAAVVLLAGAGGGTVWWVKKHRAAAPAAEVQQPAPIPPVPPPPESAPEPAAATASPPPTPAETTLTNDTIIDLVQNNVPTSVILSQIRSSKTDFNFSPPELIRLAKAHVPAMVIETMRNPSAPPPVTASKPKKAPEPEQPAAPPPQPVATAAPKPAPVVATPAPPVAPAPVPVVTKAPATPTATATATVQSTIADGTPVPLSLAADIPADISEGQVIHFTVTVPVQGSGGAVVIVKGAAATGEIVEAAKKKFLGTSKAQYRMVQVIAVDGHNLNLRATPTASPEGPPRRPVENAGQRHTKDTTAFAGSAYIGYVDGDQTVSVKK